MPYPKKDESQSEYISRFMSSEEAQKSYPDQKQRVAVAYSIWKEHHKKKESTKETQLEKGTKIESEHKDTLDWIKAYLKVNGKFPPYEEVYERIAKNHLDEFEKYYSALMDMEKELKTKQKETDIRVTLQGISLREEEGEFYSEGFIATTHVDRAHEEDAQYTALTKEACQQIVDFINSGIATIEGVGSTRTVSYRHDWVKKQDPTMTPAGMAVPPAELRQLSDGHFGVWCKTHHNKGHPLYDKIVYDVKHGYLPGYSIEFKEGDSFLKTIASKTVKIIKSITNFVGYAFADARMIANPKAVIESFGYKEITGDFMVEEEKKVEVATEVKETGVIDKSKWKIDGKGYLNSDKAEEDNEDKAKEDFQEKKFSEKVKDSSRGTDLDDETEEEYAKRIAEALAKGEEIPKKKGKERTFTESTKASGAQTATGIKETEVKVEEISAKVRESKEFKEEVAKLKISTRVLNTAAGEEQMEDIKIKEMKEALAKNDINTFNVQARELIDSEHLVEKALANPDNYTRGFKSNLKTRVIGKGLKIIGDIQTRGTLDSATNAGGSSTYTQSPVEFADLFMPGIIQTFNTQYNLFGFLKKIQHPGGMYFQWKMVTNMDPLSTTSAVSRDDVTVIKNYSTKYNYQTPLKVYRRGVSVTDFIQRYAAQSLGDLFQAEVQLQMDQMMIDVESDIFAEVADGTGVKALGLEAVADQTGNTTLYGYTRSTTNRLANTSLATCYVNAAAAIAESTIRNGIQIMATHGVHPSKMAIVTSPKGKNFIFNLLDTNRRFNTTLAEFGFDQKTVSTYDGIPVIESWKCDSTLATSTSSTACLYIIDVDSDVIVMAMEPKLVGLAKVGPATEAYLEMNFAHVYMQPRKIHMIDNFSTG